MIMKVLFFLVLNFVEGTKDYLKLTLWPLGGSSWQYPFCSETFHIDYDISYISISHLRGSQFTNPVPCYCQIYATHSTDIRDINVHFRNNFQATNQYSYSYGDWYKTNPNGLLRFSIKAHSSYTMFEVYLNDYQRTNSLYNDRNIAISIDKGTISLECSNNNFTTEATTAPTNIFTFKKTPVLHQDLTTKRDHPTAQMITSMMPKPTNNNSVIMEASAGNNNSNRYFKDLPIILGPIAAAIIFFVIILILGVVIIMKCRVQRNNNEAEDKKPSRVLKNDTYESYTHSYYGDNEKIVELSYIYTDDDNYSHTKHPAKETLLSSKRCNNQFTLSTKKNKPNKDRGSKRSNDSELVPLKIEVINNHQHDKMTNSFNSLSEFETEIQSFDSSPDEPSTEETNHDDSLMTQFLLELNKKLPSNYSANSSQDPKAHYSSTLPATNTFQTTNFTSCNNQVPLSNCNEKVAKRSTLPVIKPEIKPKPKFDVKPTGKNHLYVNIGKQRDNTISDGSSHYAQIDLTSLVKREPPLITREDDYKIIYAELDLKKKTPKTT